MENSKPAPITVGAQEGQSVSVVAGLLRIVDPSGLEEFFLAIGKPVAFGTFLPPATDPEPTKNIKAIGEKYGQQQFPPNYLDNK